MSAAIAYSAACACHRVWSSLTFDSCTSIRAPSDLATRAAHSGSRVNARSKPAAASWPAPMPAGGLVAAFFLPPFFFPFFFFLPPPSSSPPSPSPSPPASGSASAFSSGSAPSPSSPPSPSAFTSSSASPSATSPPSPAGASSCAASSFSSSACDDSSFAGEGGTGSFGGEYPLAPAHMRTSGVIAPASTNRPSRLSSSS
mmetsp:Transcript_6186/g.28371  ORF Transcript_6186/g.28371 Transcript_6186/m.28371 type:complete len:200 (+) Transcript_6186:896-1495(+)